MEVEHAIDYGGALLSPRFRARFQVHGLDRAVGLRVPIDRVILHPRLVDLALALLLPRVLDLLPFGVLAAAPDPDH
eukprot:CAMPEP_0180165070 /NCGR_PEP_ID=MMETSP0986-20121125/30760_1 /TAXON_ID=697907 /ORGANISM="non described non described, Strain CCMP2293" /LENGTH=75 /DNA_ID=CAMNT_0022115995 /DNA_START=107 /DNA_END=334 /DNA_ORIENTATION=+